MNDFKYKNMTVGLNYGTIDAPHDDTIYLELSSGNYAGIEGIISLTPGEAEMIAYKILEYVDLFKGEEINE